MNRLKLGIALTLALTIGVAATAPAATEKLKGEIEGDSDAKVTAKVVIEDGAPVRVEGLAFRNVDFKCESGQTLQGTVEAPSLLPVRKNGNFETRNSDVEIDGKVKLKGRKIVGELKAELKFSGERCVTKGKFKAS